MKEAKVRLVLIETFHEQDPGLWSVIITVYYESGRLKEYYGDSVEEAISRLPHPERYRDMELVRTKEGTKVTGEWWKPRRET